MQTHAGLLNCLYALPATSPFPSQNAPCPCTPPSPPPGGAALVDLREAGTGEGVLARFCGALGLEAPKVWREGRGRKGSARAAERERGENCSAARRAWEELFDPSSHAHCTHLEGLTGEERQASAQALSPSALRTAHSVRNIPPCAAPSLPPPPTLRTRQDARAAVAAHLRCLPLPTLLVVDNAEDALRGADPGTLPGLVQEVGAGGGGPPAGWARSRCSGKCPGVLELVLELRRSSPGAWMVQRWAQLYHRRAAMTPREVMQQCRLPCRSLNANSCCKSGGRMRNAVCHVDRTWGGGAQTGQCFPSQI